ncbi:MAG: exodeoxyribonuclease VII small subunit [Phocaeicola sp.]|uniref:exodeoxyribonuclease VII small subunit n=1 Tax=Phocaeicola TaxID=909656 RepID=UPI00234F0901|nr:exodeoxyribonuclease VII small subunit [Phocaeicola oris]MCE2615904.1 exodeoxyribonuclease VII small subunit [Phocaeicola oris]
MEKKQTYEQAMKRLEEIVSRIDNGELDIDNLSTNLKEAQELIKFCRDRLYKTDDEIKKMLKENEIIESKD